MVCWTTALIKIISYSLLLEITSAIQYESVYGCKYTGYLQSGEQYQAEIKCHIQDQFNRYKHGCCLSKHLRILTCQAVGRVYCEPGYSDEFYKSIPGFLISTDFDTQTTSSWEDDNDYSNKSITTPLTIALVSMCLLIIVIATIAYLMRYQSQRRMRILATNAARRTQDDPNDDSSNVEAQSRDDQHTNNNTIPSEYLNDLPPSYQYIENYPRLEVSLSTNANQDHTSGQLPPPYDTVMEGKNIGNISQNPQSVSNESVQ